MRGGSGPGERFVVWEICFSEIEVSSSDTFAERLGIKE